MALAIIIVIVIAPPKLFKPHMKLLLALALAALKTTIAFAAADEAIIKDIAKRTNLEPAFIRENYDACDGGVTLPMSICFSYRLAVEDAKLNKSYQKLMSRAREGKNDASLVRAQRAWIAYRDAACSFEGEFAAGGGSAEGIYVLTCKIDLTKQRTERLTANLQP